MDKIPTLEEEVNRKALNALAMVQGDKEKCNISKETFDYVMRVLHEAFAGIVSEEFIDIMNRMMEEEFPDKRYMIGYTNGVNKMTLSIDSREKNVRLYKDNQNDVQLLKEVRCKSYEELKAVIQKIVSALTSKGFKKNVKQNN